MHSVERPVTEKTKSEIERRLESMGDYVKMSYLQRALKSGLDFDTKKFVLTKLSVIYNQRGMFLEAAKTMRSAADINTTFKEKIRDFMKAVELYIKGGNYQEADILFSQAVALGSDKEKTELKNQFKDIYIKLADSYYKSDKRINAKKAYEKVIDLDLAPEQKKEVQEKLLELYNKLGLIREYYRLKSSI